MASQKKNLNPGIKTSLESYAPPTEANESEIIDRECYTTVLGSYSVTFRIFFLLGITAAEQNPMTNFQNIP